MSERHACRLVRQPRSTQRRRLRGNVDRSPEAEARLVELAQTHPAWGCPKLHRQLRHAFELMEEGKSIRSVIHF